jgi:uncharacterized protein (DUF1697 family)
MTTWVAFFRGINVGGNNMLPMKALVMLLQKQGCEDVQTYIQSGNAVFSCKETKAETIGKRISAAVYKAHGFEPRVLVLSLKELEKAMSANPFPHAEAEHKSLHLYFLAEPANKPNVDGLHALKTGNESFVLTKTVFYLHTPDGLGKSKVAERVEKLLGVAATARNWRTVCKVSELCSPAN